MTDDMHRTPDWQRLKNTGLLAIRDEPGRIMVSRTSPIEKSQSKLMLFVIGFPFGAMVLGMMGGVWGALGAGAVAGMVSGILFLCGVIPARIRLARFADCVAFTPEGVYFFRKAKLFHKLPREGMQQIVADADGQLRYHRFIADVGYACAFPLTDQTDQMLINNILMTAFSQAVWFDLVLMDELTHDAAAPNIQELVAVSSYR